MSNLCICLFNVVTLFPLAFAVERALGSFKLTLLWAVSGIAGTYASIYSVPPPYDIGSGASQAIMGVAGAAIVVMWRNPERPWWLKGTLIVTLGNALVLDLVFGSGPKLGHIVGFALGLILAIGLVPTADGPPVQFRVQE
jgi:rhomboid protease GluP